MHGHGHGFGRDFGGFGGHGGFGHHGRGRAKRGDVQPAILALLAEQDMHGYQIIQELTERSGGAWTPSPGSVYPTLQALEDQGLVTSSQVSGKRVFSLTDTGREAAAGAENTTPWDNFAPMGGPKSKVRDAMFGLGAATVQIMRTGTDEQAEQTAEILDTARKAIYRMLAGE